MKNSKLYIIAIAITSLMATSCTKEKVRIEGTGTITTRTLNVANFSKIAAAGVDDVIIRYGTEQYVEVTGHPNIIDRITLANDTVNAVDRCNLSTTRYCLAGFNGSGYYN